MSAQTEFYIAVFENFGLVAREIVIELAERVRQALPSEREGRRRLLSPERAGMVCAFVADLYGKGVKPLRLAKARAAKRFGVSDRMVERAWKDRGNAPERSFGVQVAVAKILVPRGGPPQDGGSGAGTGGANGR